MSHNTWIHRTVRIGVRPLVGTAITPNHLTTLRLLTGLAAAAGYAAGTEGWTLAASAIFVLSVLLDRADGDFARLSGKTSRAGHIYDFVADGASNTAVFIGIGFGASALDDWGPVLGLIAGAAVALTEWLVVRLDAMGHSSASLGGFWGFDPDDAILLVPVAMAFGQGTPLIVAASIGAPAAALVFLRLYRRARLRKRNRLSDSSVHAQ